MTSRSIFTKFALSWKKSIPHFVKIRQKVLVTGSSRHRGTGELTGGFFCYFEQKAWCHYCSNNVQNVINRISFPTLNTFSVLKGHFRTFSFWLYRVSQEEWTKLRESVPYVKIYRYNPKHLCPKLNGYGDKGQRNVWSICGSTYCTWFVWRNTHTLCIVCPCPQLAQARSSLRLHM